MELWGSKWVFTLYLLIIINNLLLQQHIKFNIRFITDIKNEAGIILLFLILKNLMKDQNQQKTEWFIS